MLWNYLSGYVIIQIEGLALERFVNLALQKGIDIWNISRSRDGSMTAYVSVQGFYALHRLKRRTDYRIRIMEKRGMPILLSRLRRRKVLLFGWIIVLALLLSVSRYIWFIDIQGCDKVEKAFVLEVLSENGVAVGSKRHGLALPELAQAIRQSDSRIGWAGLNLTGVILRVSLKEAQDIPDIIDDSTPASIYAQKPGVIRSITALNGKACVAVGDVVEKGQLLISGSIGAEGAEPIHVRARGSVIAQTAYTFIGQAGPTLEKPARTGESRVYNGVSLYGLYFEQRCDEYEHYESEQIFEHMLNGCFLPLKVQSLRCYELKPMQVHASQEELTEAALSYAQQKLNAFLPQDAVVLSKHSSVKVLEHGVVRAIISVNTQEEIGQTGEL